MHEEYEYDYGHYVERITPFDCIAALVLIIGVMVWCWADRLVDPKEL